MENRPMSSTTQIIAGRPVELVPVEMETVKVRILPGGRMDTPNAAKYVNRKTKTLAMWRMQGIGPEWSKCGGRVFYNKEALDAFMRGKGA
jgi:hypothetical protein